MTDSQKKPSPPALAGAEVAALQAVAQTGDKLQRKAAKRALFVLRARGVAVPEPPAAARSPEPPAAARSEELPRTVAVPAGPAEPALLTTIDGQGVRAIFLPRRAERGFTLHVALVADDAGGLLELQSVDLSRKGLKLHRDRLSAETRAVLREVPAAEAEALLLPVLAQAASSAAKALAQQLRTRPSPAAGNAAATAPTSPSAEDLRASAALFDTPPLRGYVPPQAALMTLAHKLEEATVSPLYLDEAQRRSQIRRLIEQAVLDFFTAEQRVRYANRLDDAAQFFDPRGDAAAAAQARAVAVALRSERSPLEIPFARGLFERLIAAPADAGAEPPGRAASAPVAKSAGNLIVVP